MGNLKIIIVAAVANGEPTCVESMIDCLVTVSTSGRQQLAAQVPIVGYLNRGKKGTHVSPKSRLSLSALDMLPVVQA